MKTTHTILYATDFSASSEAALLVAEPLARKDNARLLIVHVRPKPTVAYTTGSVAVIEPEGSADDVRKRLDQYRPKDPAIPVDYLVVDGDPATEILNISRNANCDFIVMGTHGRTGLSRLVMGSVAEQVTRHAQCPVVVVRCPSLSLGPPTTA